MFEEHKPCMRSHDEPTTLGKAAEQYLANVRRIAQGMSVRDLRNPSGRMTNLTVVRTILNEVADEKMKRTVYSTRLNADAMIDVRSVDSSTRIDSVHQEYPYDFERSCRVAVEEVAGFQVEKIGRGHGGDLLWMAKP